MCQEKKTEGIQCALCGKTVDKLYNIEETMVDGLACEDCYLEIEGEPPPYAVRFRSKKNLSSEKEPAITPVSITLRMDHSMARCLEGHAEMEGFLTVEGYMLSILFREAVLNSLEDIENQRYPITNEQIVSFFEEMRKWLANGQR